MLLVSFLLWLCGMCCELCTLTAAAALCAGRGALQPHGCLLWKERCCVFRCSSCCFVVFFYVTPHFCSYHFRFLLLSLLPASAAAVCNYSQLWEKGKHRAQQQPVPSTQVFKVIYYCAGTNSFLHHSFCLIQNKFFSLDPTWTQASLCLLPGREKQNELLSGRTSVSISGYISGAVQW